MPKKKPLEPASDALVNPLDVYRVCQNMSRMVMILNGLPTDAKFDKEGIGNIAGMCNTAKVLALACSELLQTYREDLKTKKE